MGYVVTEGYTCAYGTSMAAPMVSGAVALMLEQDPAATFEDIYRRLEYSSVDLGDAGFDPYFGFGRVDAFKNVLQSILPAPVAGAWGVR